MPRDYRSDLSEEQRFGGKPVPPLARPKPTRNGKKSQNASPRRRPREDRYEEWTRSELHTRAGQLGVRGHAKMSRQDLIEALRSR